MRGILLGLAFLFAGSGIAAASPTLYGLRVAGSVASIVEINPATGALGAVRASYAVGSTPFGLTWHSGQRAFYSVFGNRGLMRFDPSSGVMTTLTVSGIGSGTLSGLEYWDAEDRLVATHTLAGGSLEYLLSAIDPVTGAVLAGPITISGEDNDALAETPSGALLSVDLNKPQHAVQVLNNPFGGLTRSNYGIDPPSSADWYWVAMDPTNGTLYTTFRGWSLASVGPSSVTTIGSFGTGVTMWGLAFADLAEVPTPAGAGLLGLALLFCRRRT